MPPKRVLVILNVTNRKITKEYAFDLTNEETVFHVAETAIDKTGLQTTWDDHHVSSIKIYDNSFDQYVDVENSADPVNLGKYKIDCTIGR